jgi:N-acetyl-anhydromuramyl-L-alanine amidase AmpD
MKIVDMTSKLPRHAVLRYKVRDVSTIDTVVIHHSLTVDRVDTKDSEAFANYHINTKGWAGIGYHYVIDSEGRIEKTNDERVVSYHVGDANQRSIGICMIGDFRDSEPTEKQYSACIWLVKDIQRRYPSIAVKGHSEMPNYSWKECPAIDMNDFRSDLVPVSSWAREAREKLIELGITDGKRPKDTLTREEAWTLIHRVIGKRGGWVD